MKAYHNILDTPNSGWRFHCINCNENFNRHPTAKTCTGKQRQPRRWGHKALASDAVLVTGCVVGFAAFGVALFNYMW